MTNMQHEAYSFAVREYGQLHGAGYSGAQLEQLLTGLVARRLAADFPKALEADRRSATSYGVAQALRDLEPAGKPGGVVGTIVGTVEAAPGVVAGAAEEAASAVATGAEAVAGAAAGAIEAILQAVELPRARLPVRAPVDSLGAFHGLMRGLGSTLPTRLATVNRARGALRRVGL